jgi:hypothetical protein
MGKMVLTKRMATASSTAATRTSMRVKPPRLLRPLSSK